MNLPIDFGGAPASGPAGGLPSIPGLDSILGGLGGAVPKGSGGSPPKSSMPSGQMPDLMSLLGGAQSEDCLFLGK
jgi:hypothetical protein